MRGACFLRDLTISPQGQAFLIDRKGLLIATSSGETPFDSRPLPEHAQNVDVTRRRLAAVDSANPVTLPPGQPSGAPPFFATPDGSPRMTEPHRKPRAAKEYDLAVGLRGGA